MDLSVVIVSHRHERYLAQCLGSLMEGLSGVSHEIILVDNAGHPDLNAMVKSRFPQVKLRVNPSPQGFARNCNQGFLESRGRYLLLLNPDTRFIRGNFAEVIRRMNRIPKVGAVCGQLLNADLSVQSHIRRFPTLPAILFRGLNLEKFFPRSSAYKRYMMEGEAPSGEKAIDWCSGAFLMIKSGLFREIGMMDERFYLYYEDIDLCYRLKKSGWHNYYLPQVQVVHYYQRDSAKTIFNPLKWLHVKSLLYFFWKHKYLFNPRV